jgi:AcrR family transcriptional regulator
MEAIAGEAAVTMPILHRTVGDKDAVATALAERFVDRINAAGAEAVKGAVDGRDSLRRLIGSFINVVENDRNLFLFVTDAGANEERVGLVLRLADRSARPIGRDLAAQRVAAGLDPAVALTWAYGLIGTLHFATLWWLRDQTCSASDIADHLTELLWSGIGGPTTPRPHTSRARSVRP